jgi:hypothetical protein
MLWEGLVEKGLAMTRMVHERYHAARRNPWNEIECSDHWPATASFSPPAGLSTTDRGNTSGGSVAGSISRLPLWAAGKLPSPLPSKPVGRPHVTHPFTFVATNINSPGYFDPYGLLS